MSTTVFSAKAFRRSSDRVVPFLHLHAHGAVAFGVLHKIRVSVIEPEGRESLGLLLPLDEPEGIVVQDQHDQGNVVPQRRLQLPGVHHEPAVAHHGKHVPVRSAASSPRCRRAAPRPWSPEHCPAGRCWACRSGTAARTTACRCRCPASGCPHAPAPRARAARPPAASADTVS